MTYLWIGLGSAIGGMGRHLCANLIIRVFGESFPWGTILVNVIGSLAIGFIAALIPPESRFFFASDIRNFKDQMLDVMEKIRVESHADKLLEKKPVVKA